MSNLITPIQDSLDAVLCGIRSFARRGVFMDLLLSLCLACQASAADDPKPIPAEESDLKFKQTFDLSCEPSYAMIQDREGAILEKGGHQVTLAENGVEALEQLEQPGLFDIILMDCQMPVVDGFEATLKLRLREQERGWPRYRVVAMTANAMESDKDACLEAGMDGYLSKPVRMGKLLEVATDGDLTGPNYP